MEIAGLTPEPQVDHGLGARAPRVCHAIVCNPVLNDRKRSNEGARLDVYLVFGGGPRGVGRRERNAVQYRGSMALRSLMAPFLTPFHAPAGILVGIQRDSQEQANE